MTTQEPDVALPSCLIKTRLYLSTMPCNRNPVVGGTQAVHSLALTGTLVKPVVY